MTRRWMTVATVLAFASGVAACTQTGTVTDPGAGVTLPPGTQLVAQLRYEDGLLPWGSRLIQAPKLAVFSDGLAVAEARTVLRLTPAEVRTVVGGLRRDLSGFGSTVDVGAQYQVSDAPYTVLQVLDADGSLRRVSAYALDIASGYPDRLVAARQSMADLAERVTTEGSPYQSSRVRLVAALRQAESAPVPDWPATVPVPPKDDNTVEARKVDLDGDQAEAVVRQWPTADPSGAWPAYRIPDGTVFGVAWRYLLPHE